MPRRIKKVYFDLPNYVKPKEVTKAFKLMHDRKAFFKRLDEATRGTTKQGIKDELAVHEEELIILMKIITPKNCAWSITEARAADKTFYLMNIYEEVYDELSAEAQDAI